MHLSGTAADQAPTMPTPLDLASLLDPPTDYWLMGLVFGGCLAITLATRILACRLAQRDTPVVAPPTTDAAATRRLLRWHEALIICMVGAMVTYLFGAGIILVRAGEAALFTTALVITAALTPLLVIVLETMQLPAAERAAEHAHSLASHKFPTTENAPLRRAA
jgi:hypothetical protein